MKRVFDKIQLIHLNGPLKGNIQEYDRTKILIGRHPSCHLIFPNDTVVVSRKHATISLEGDHYTITDHSTNGTFLNGKQIKKASLRDGDIIHFSEDGPQIRFSKPIFPQFDSHSAPKSNSHSAETPPIKGSEMGEGFFIHSLRKMKTSNPPPLSRMPSENRAQLVIQYGPTLKSFDKSPIILGSSKACDMIFNQANITDKHAEIYFEQNKYWVKSLSPKTHVAINGIPVTSATPLSSHDILSLSPSGPKFNFFPNGRLAEIENLSVSNDEQCKEKPAPPAKAKGISRLMRLMKSSSSEIKFKTAPSR